MGPLKFTQVILHYLCLFFDGRLYNEVEQLIKK